MSSLYPDASDLAAARRDLVRAVAVLTFDAITENTLAARNVMYHSEEMMRWLDAFLSGQDHVDPREPPGQ
jgi:hypothetical protein